jgi:large subunit ribosomal protein L6
MKHAFTESYEVPTGISVSLANGVLSLTKSGTTLTRTIARPCVTSTLSGNTLTFTAPKANKIQVKEIRALLAHVRNLVRGLDKKFVYQLEACNVHFPMTLKVEGKRLAINNFLGEKTPRYARIEENVDVEVKGTRVTVSSHDIESAGRTVSLIERATHVRNRDRRVFQDGIFLVERPGRAA